MRLTRQMRSAAMAFLRGNPRGTRPQPRPLIRTQTTYLARTKHLREEGI